VHNLQVPFFEIDSVQAINPLDDALQESDDVHIEGAGRSRVKMTNTVEIRTNVDGHNAGRVYYIRTESGAECRRIVKHLTKYSTAARKHFELRNRWDRFRDNLKQKYDSMLVQGLVGALILSVIALINTPYSTQLRLDLSPACFFVLMIGQHDI
jgi:hypothetical protein